MKTLHQSPCTNQRRRRAAWLASLFALGLAATAQASDLYWDADGTTTTATGGTGVWTTTNTWRNGSTTGTLQTWANGNNAFFGGTAGQVQVASGSAGLSAVNLNDSTDGYTLYTTSKSNGLTVTSTLTLAANVGLTFQSQSNSSSDTTFAVNAFSAGTGSSLTLNVIPSSGTTFGSFRVNLTGANASVAMPTTITAAANVTSGLIGYVALATGTTISGTITNNSTATTMLAATNGNDLTLGPTAVISGTAGLQFSAGTSGGGGTVTLNAANTYGGVTTFNAANSGVVKLGVDNALPTTTAVTMAATSNQGGILDLNGHNQTIASLTSGGGGGSITNNATGTATATLTVNGSASPAAFTLAIADGATAKTGLTRSGTGGLTLGFANAYSGPTSVTGGTLTVSPTGSINGSTSVSVSNTGALTLQNATALADAGTLSLTGSGTTVSLSAGTGTSETIAALMLNGTSVNPGTYTFDALNSMATNDGITNNPFSSANGETLTITPVPEPATVLGGLLLVGALGWNQRRRLGGLIGLLRAA